MMHKRAVEMQFNWIFILIAGAIILAFFFSVVQKQRALSEQKLSIALSSQMDAIFTGAIESKGTVQTLATPKPGIAFACSDVCECVYTIGNKAAEFRDKILFAPALIKDQDAIAWAIEWKLPFRIANFLMLTNPKVKYYIVYDTSNQLSAQLYQKVSKALPREINQQTFQIPDAVYQILPEGYAHTRFVFLGTQQPNLAQLQRDFGKEDVSGLWIDADAKQAIFYEKADPDTLDFNAYPTLLAGDATAYGAIFAADHQMYDCMMRRAFQELGMIAEVSSKRAQELQKAMDDECTGDPVHGRCSCAYVIQDIALVGEKASFLGASFDPATEQTQSALSTVTSMQSALKRDNENLFLQSCPELY